MSILKTRMPGMGHYLQSLSTSSQFLLLSHPIRICHALIARRSISTYNHRSRPFNINMKYAKWMHISKGENTLSTITYSWNQRKSFCRSSGRSSVTDETPGTLDSTICSKVTNVLRKFPSISGTTLNPQICI